MKTAKEVTRIPFPKIILKGDWGGITYAITSDAASVEEHNKIVEAEIAEIIRDFDGSNHYSVSLRKVKEELVHADEGVSQWCTLVQFRVRDSY